MSIIAAAIAGIGMAACGGGDSAPQTFTQAPVACAELTGMTIPAASIGLPTTGAVVTNAQVVPPSGTGAVTVGEYCKVEGEINPVDQAAPKIKFQVGLPANWNKKALMYGGGGNNGTIPNIAGSYATNISTQPVPLGRGYAVFGSDSGHQGKNDGTIDPVRDASFAVNDEALRNFTGEALKKTRDVAGAIIKARYATTPEKVYFVGGSTGGREALLSISNWPQDFEGAIAVYPAWDSVALNLAVGRLGQEFAKPGAYVSEQKRDALYKAAINACDGLDGIADGVISNNAACNATFDPVTATIDGTTPLRCAGGADTGDNCLSDVQISARLVTRDGMFGAGTMALRALLLPLNQHCSWWALETWLLGILCLQ
ncbi:tannase/feruloyl esterase family alpha/beta hydrolase [Noviherbaspirillum sp. Root189]|uniref:tannase/feruloyl esterase family alpha/beta hydrolase n=1 Tax=Noviherbaspirillum sp. Root189 TaxID=1736487 RepID=UPI001F2DD58B|nr:tannase/feruloyl esterase family alpha/beta hydrolase [Noviherbaspirillum sp. Root189]